MKKITTWLLLVLTTATFWSCSDDSNSTAPGTAPSNTDAPSINFISPVAGDSVVKGGSMQISIKMKAKKDLITKIKFLVDGYLAQEMTGQACVTDTSRIFSWTAPATTGTHTFKVIAQAPGDLEGNATVANIRVVNAGTTPSSMVLVNGGTFQMGQENMAIPVHSVTLSSFYIGKYEVTQSEWVATMGTNPSYFSSDLQRPVENVSWYDILVYCNKRSIAESLAPVYSINGSTNPANWGTVPASSNNPTWNSVTSNWNAKGYRMPTEAEWEFAARGGSSSQGYVFSGSNTIGNVAWYSSNSGYTTHTVGTKAPNELGIYDMTGNVTEWNWDWYGIYSSSSQNNPVGATTGSVRIVRGGSYDDDDDYDNFYCRLWFRYGNYPYDRYNALGFRLTRSL